MAITRPVTISQAILGDGETTVLGLDQVLVSVTVSDGSPVTGVLSGQSINLTFAAPPAALAIRTLVMVLGF
jgi:hypothetical protein